MGVSQPPERALAYYLWPPQWIAEAPTWAELGSVEAPRPSDLGDMIFEADLPVGVRVRAFRDGMIAFVLRESSERYDNDFLAGWGTRCGS